MIHLLIIPIIIASFFIGRFVGNKQKKKSTEVSHEIRRKRMETRLQRIIQGERMRSG